MSPSRLYRIVCREGAGLIGLDGKPREICGHEVMGARLSGLIQEHATHLLQAHADQELTRRLLEHTADDGRSTVLKAQAPEVVVYEATDTWVG